MGELKLVANITLDRLDDQIKWYSKSSKWNQDRFKWLKVVEVVAAALVPFFAGWGIYRTCSISCGDRFTRCKYS